MLRDMVTMGCVDPLHIDSSRHTAASPMLSTGGAVFLRLQQRDNSRLGAYIDVFQAHA